MRITLKNLQTQLAVWPALFRCHRSFLVNRTKIIAVTGNARTMELQLEDVAHTVPVSRNIEWELFSTIGSPV